MEQVSKHDIPDSVDAKPDYLENYVPDTVLMKNIQR